MHTLIFKGFICFLDGVFKGAFKAKKGVSLKKNAFSLNIYYRIEIRVNR